jgi:hypothetical protein
MAGKPQKTTKFHHGRPCKICRTTLKYTSRSSCVTCTRKKAIRAYRGNPDAYSLRRKQLYKLNGPDRYRDSKLKAAYGIDLSTYNALLKTQKYVCAICKRVCMTGKRLAVDHNHSTKKVRGLLCAACNRALGNFGDSTKTLRVAIKYLENSK